MDRAQLLEMYDEPDLMNKFMETRHGFTVEVSESWNSGSQSAVLRLVDEAGYSEVCELSRTQLSDLVSVLERAINVMD